MKIKTESDLNQLDEAIQNELGIDIKKYRSKEIEENISELLSFLTYAIRAIQTPIFIAFLLFVAGFFLLDLVHIEKLIYAVVGIGLFLTIGAVVGVLLLIWGIKNDVLEVINYSLNLTKTIQNDVGAVKTQMTDGEKERKYQLFFKGVLHLVTIPIVTKIVAEKVPFVGGIFQGLIRKVLTAVADNSLVFKLLLHSDILESGSTTAAIKDYENDAKAVHSFVATIDKAVSKVLRVVQFPLFIVLVVQVFILLVFLYLIH